MRALDTTTELESLSDVSLANASKHIATVARALIEMGDCATAISSTQRVNADEAAAIELLLPVLSARYGLRATVEREGPSLTVRLERAKA